MGSTLANEIEAGINTNIKGEQMVNGYKFASNTHTITLNGAHMSTTGLLTDMPVGIVHSNVNGKQVLEKITVDVAIKFSESASAAAMNVLVNLAYNRNYSQYAVTEIDNLNPSLYGGLLTV